MERSVWENNKIRKALLKKKVLSRYVELQTLLCEIGLVLSNRPLTFMYKNPIDTALKQNHLLHGTWLNLQGIPSKEDNVDINSCYKYIRNLFQLFIER